MPTENDNFLATFLEIVRSALPYMLMSKVIDPIIGIIGFPIMLYLFSKFKKWYEEKTPPHSIVITRDSRGYEVDTMLKIVFYLKNVLKVKDLVYIVDRDITFDDGTAKTTTDFYNQRAQGYSIHQMRGTPSFYFRNHKFYLGYNVEVNKLQSSKFLTISSDNEQILDEFITECILNYKKFVKHMQTIMRSQDIISFEYTKNAWSPSKLNIMKTFDTVFLPSKLVKELKDDVDEFLNSEELYKRDGIPWRRGYLFHSTPGQGKSSTVYAISTYTKRNIYRLPLGECTSFDELKVAVKNIDKGSIIIIDDIDRIKIIKKIENNKSGDEKESGEPIKLKTEGEKTTINRLTMQNILEIFDGYSYFDGCIIIFTANNIDLIEEALIRPGRIDRRFKFDSPKNEVIQKIFQHFYQKPCPINKQILNRNKISSSEIINTFILSNRKNYQRAVDLLNEKLAEC